MRHVGVLIGLFLASTAPDGYAATAKENELKKFIDEHVEKIKPLEKQANLAWWDAAVTGDPKAYDRSSEMQLQIRRVYSDPKDFAFLKEVRQSRQVKDPLLARQLTVLYNAYLANQIEPDLLKQIVELGTQIEKNFSTFRGTIDGKKVTDNEIKEILKDETDSAQAGKDLVGEQAGRRGGRGGPGPAGQAAQRGGPQARLRQLPHDGPGHRRAGCEGTGQDLRRSVPADQQAVRESEGRVGSDPRQEVRRGAGPS